MTGTDGDPSAAGLIDAGLIDTAVVDEMIATMRPDAFGRILEALVADHAPRILRIRAAAAAGDLRALDDEAHDLASTLGSFGGTEAASLARDLMRAARSGEEATALALAPAVVRLADATVDALLRLRGPR